MRFRVFDIETIPDPSAWTPGDEKWRLVPGRVDRDLVRAVLVREEPFPPPQAHRVVAISWVDLVLDAAKSPRYALESVHTDCLWSVERGGGDEAERQLLAQFGRSVSGVQGGLCFVTWNGRTFDLPVISMRSMKHGIACPWYYADKDVRYRYSAEGHVDLMDFLGDFGAARSMKLGDAARLIGLPGKTGMTGASVGKTYEETLARGSDPIFCAEKMGEVARYCLQDSIQTALLFLRSRYHVGKIGRDEYHRCLETFMRPAIDEVIQVDWDAVRLPADPDPLSVGEVG